MRDSEAGSIRRSRRLSAYAFFSVEIALMYYSSSSSRSSAKPKSYVYLTRKKGICQPKVSEQKQDRTHAALYPLCFHLFTIILAYIRLNRLAVLRHSATYDILAVIVRAADDATRQFLAVKNLKALDIHGDILAL